MDVNSRRLQRQFGQTHSLHDEVEWLRARARLGLIDHDRIELAALALHPAASRYLGSQHPLVRWVELVGLWNPARWLRKLATWGQLPLARLALAMLPPGGCEDLREACLAYVRAPGLETRAQLMHAIPSSSPREQTLAQRALVTLACELSSGRAPLAAASLLLCGADDPAELRLEACRSLSAWTLGGADPLAESARRS